MSGEGCSARPNSVLSVDLFVVHAVSLQKLKLHKRDMNMDLMLYEHLHSETPLVSQWQPL